MPEGDTIFRTAQTLNRAIGGRVVTRFETAYAHLAVVDDQNPIAGRTVESVTSAGKHVLISFARLREDASAGQASLVLRTHMRMNGSWHIYRPGEPWRLPRSAMRIAIETDEWVAVAFNVPVAEFLSAHAVGRRSAVAELGPDLLGESFDASEAVARMRMHTDEPIAEVLLNQRVVAGIGNVYKSETLFLSGIHPETPVRALEDPVLHDLLGRARRLLQANVRPTSPAAIVTYGGFRRSTGRRDFGEGLWVYGRNGLPCRKCGTAIERKKTGPYARGTYWCPKCQAVRPP